MDIKKLSNFHKKFEKLCYLHDAGDVLDALLEWIMFGFCADESITWDSGKRFSENEQKQFYPLFQEWVAVMNDRIKGDGDWFDLPGMYYENYVAGKSRRDSRGQFFTPKHVCDLNVKIAVGEVKTGQRISDPCSGSGRFLLTLHANARETSFSLRL